MANDHVPSCSIPAGSPTKSPKSAPGKARIKSITRMMKSSGNPTRNETADQPQRHADQAVVSAIDRKPTCKDTRPPYKTRLMISRPNLSVPKGCANDGPRLRSGVLRSMGSLGRDGCPRTRTASTISARQTRPKHRYAIACANLRRIASSYKPVGRSLPSNRFTNQPCLCKPRRSCNENACDFA